MNVNPSIFVTDNQTKCTTPRQVEAGEMVNVTCCLISDAHKAGASVGIDRYPAMTRQIVAMVCISGWRFGSHLMTN